MMSNDTDCYSAEIEQLKASFSYRSYTLDLEFLLSDLERKIFDGKYGDGHVPILVAQEILTNAYFEKGALEPLVKVAKQHVFRDKSFFQELMQHLIKAQRLDLIEDMWRGVLRQTRAEFFYQRPEREFGEYERSNRAKNNVLDAYGEYIGYMEQLGFLDRVAELSKERIQFEKERFPVLATKPDPRKIGTELFWGLIEESANQSETTAEQVVKLGDSLREFKAIEIKRFQSFYCKLMKSLYHWNVWALAYAARDGCSDDAFEEFRTWLILQGNSKLIDTAISTPHLAAPDVPKNPDLPEASLLFTIGDAYMRRKGEPLKACRIDLERPKGKEWPEDDLKTCYPELVDYYK